MAQFSSADHQTVRKVRLSRGELFIYPSRVYHSANLTSSLTEYHVYFFQRWTTEQTRDLQQGWQFVWLVQWGEVCINTHHIHYSRESWRDYIPHKWLGNIWGTPGGIVIPGWGSRSPDRASLPAGKAEEKWINELYLRLLVSKITWWKMSSWNMLVLFLFPTGSAWLKLRTETWWSLLICQKLCCWNFLLLTKCWLHGSSTPVSTPKACNENVGVPCYVCGLLFIIDLLNLLKENDQPVPDHTWPAFGSAPLVNNLQTFQISKYYSNDFVYWYSFQWLYHGKGV